jgi:hypothetical protein
MKGLFNVLQIMQIKTGSNYSSDYADIKNEIFKLFNELRKNLILLGLREGLHSLQVTHVRESRHGEEFLGVLEHLVLLDLPLPLPPLYLYLHLLLLVSYLLTWTVTMSLHMRMTLIYFSGGVTTS